MNPFENDNAKYLDPRAVADTFIPLDSFWKLFSEKNHVLLGTRGSGKTVLARMASHDHLRLFDHPKAKDIIRSREYIGFYASARLNWVSGVRSQTQLDPDNARAYFIQRLNFVLAQSILGAFESCLKEYFDPDVGAKLEYRLVRELLALWAPESSPDREIYSLADLRRALANTDFRLQRERAKTMYRPSDPQLRDFDVSLAHSFGTGPAEHLYLARDAAFEILSIPSTSKMIVAIDELEFLSRDQHIILNSLLRTDGRGFLFKFATAPYFHYTTENETLAPVFEGHDFEYIHIDHERVVDPDGLDIDVAQGDIRYHFPVALFVKRARAAGLPANESTLRSLLGPSPILDPVQVVASDFGTTVDRLSLHANDPTRARLQSAKKEYFAASASRRPAVLAKTSDQLIRKMRSLVALRESVQSQVGAKKGTAYSGFSMVLSCTDQNPRLVIRTFKMLFPDLASTLQEGARPLSPVRQNEVMETIAVRHLDTASAVPEYGPQLRGLLEQLGNYFRRKLHAEPIGTDAVGSLKLSVTDHDMRALVHQAVAWGYMYPHFKDENRSALPSEGGEFRLAYVLAPHFRILPRRGRSIESKAIFPQMGLGMQ